MRAGSDVARAQRTRQLAIFVGCRDARLRRLHIGACIDNGISGLQIHFFQRGPGIGSAQPRRVVVSADQIRQRRLGFFKIRLRAARIIACAQGIHAHARHIHRRHVAGLQTDVQRVERLLKQRCGLAGDAHFFLRLQQIIVCTVQHHALHAFDIALVAAHGGGQRLCGCRAQPRFVAALEHLADTDDGVDVLVDQSAAAQRARNARSAD